MTRTSRRGSEAWARRASPAEPAVEVLIPTFRRDTDAFARWPLHNAANLTHLAAELELAPGEWRAYKVAWVGGCVLFRRSALVESGGFTFRPDLEPDHSGEDVAAQWRVMERFGGAGILPSGAVHLEAPTPCPTGRSTFSTCCSRWTGSADHLSGGTHQAGVWQPA